MTKSTLLNHNSAWCVFIQKSISVCDVFAFNSRNFVCEKLSWRLLETKTRMGTGSTYADSAAQMQKYQELMTSNPKNWMAPDCLNNHSYFTNVVFKVCLMVPTSLSLRSTLIFLDLRHGRSHYLSPLIHILWLGHIATLVILLIQLYLVDLYTTSK